MFIILPLLLLPSYSPIDKAHLFHLFRVKDVHPVDDDGIFKISPYPLKVQFLKLFPGSEDEKGK